MDEAVVALEDAALPVSDEPEAAAAAGVGVAEATEDEATVTLEGLGYLQSSFFKVDNLRDKSAGTCSSWKGHR